MRGGERTIRRGRVYLWTEEISGCWLNKEISRLNVCTGRAVNNAALDSRFEQWLKALDVGQGGQTGAQTVMW